MRLKRHTAESCDILSFHYCCQANCKASVGDKAWPWICISLHWINSSLGNLSQKRVNKSSSVDCFKWQLICFPLLKQFTPKRIIKNWCSGPLRTLVVDRCTTAVIIFYYFIFNVFHIEFKRDLPVEVNLVLSVFRLKTIVFAPSWRPWVKSTMLSYYGTSSTSPNTNSLLKS